MLPVLRPHAVRDLRAALMELAGWLADHPEHRGLLLLLGNRLSAQRLEDEVNSAGKILQPAVYERLRILELPEHDLLPAALREAGLTAEEADSVDHALLGHFTKKSTARPPRPAAQDLVFEHLVNAYLLGTGPMTTESITAATDFSYPTVANGLSKLGPSIRRHSDRRVELKHFPRQEWSRFVSAYERGQFCRKFTVATELARTPESLLKRFLKLALPETAIGGIHAAHHYDPEFDLVGYSRLDICVSGKLLDRSKELARQIDPALEPAPFSTANPALVIWPVHRAEPLFQHDPQSDTRWADPVTCLLALHDARLEAQTEELIKAFEQGRTRHTARA
ncbi:hypothetical protein [Wenzhouxiangella sp. EGI_FJ10409]|uniref:hypothetical protein n=1 Tax=Wenzhouxiangella sp. EGI_FJ10409 TaxID=3243767 RepID=UPI0035DCAA04